MITKYEKKMIRTLLNELVIEKDNSSQWLLMSTFLDCIWLDSKITLKQKRRYDKINDNFMLLQYKIISFKGR